MQGWFFSVELSRQVGKEAENKILILQVLWKKFKFHKEKKNA